jgi:predicted transcriptional regulator
MLLFQEMKTLNKQISSLIKRHNDMRPSQLRVYLDIAKSLREQGPQSLDQLALLSRTSADSIKKNLDFLMKEGMIENKDVLAGDVYYIASSGIKILEFFK